MKSVTTTIRDAFGSALPLLVILVAGLLVMPVAQWGTGQSGFMSGIILGVLLQTTIGVLFLAQAAGTRRVVGIVLIVFAVAWAAEYSLTEPVWVFRRAWADAWRVPPSAMRSIEVDTVVGFVTSQAYSVWSQPGVKSW